MYIYLSTCNTFTLYHLVLRYQPIETILDLLHQGKQVTEHAAKERYAGYFSAINLDKTSVSITSLVSRVKYVVRNARW